jgi:hypothetical protein
MIARAQIKEANMVSDDRQPELGLRYRAVARPIGTTAGVSQRPALGRLLLT